VFVLGGGWISDAAVSKSDIYTDVKFLKNEITLMLI